MDRCSSIAIVQRGSHQSGTGRRTDRQSVENPGLLAYQPDVTQTSQRMNG